MATVYNSLFDFNGEASSDKFGTSVSMSHNGIFMAVGAPYATGAVGAEAGHVRVFKYDGSAWNQLGNDIDGEATFDHSGISVSINKDGSIVAIGAYNNDGTGSDAGHVRVYQYSSGAWNQLGSDIDGEAGGDQSGISVSINDDGTIVAIGSNGNDDSGANSGSVRVYQYSGGSWGQLGADLDGETSGDQSGFSVDLNMDGTIVAIGAINNDGSGSNSGQVRVYQYSGGSWSQLGADIDGETTLDTSGYSVSLNGDGTIVAIGATLNDGNGSTSGHVRVYEYIGSTWTQLGSDLDGEASGDQSGTSVAINYGGSVVAIGAPYNNASDAGNVRVYVYDSVTGIWSQQGGDIDGEASGDQSGTSVALIYDGDIVAIGAPLNNGTGQVRMFQYIGGGWNQTVTVDLCLGEGSIILTDQGPTPIEQLDSKIHTIKRDPIRGILHTKMTESKIVCISKDALGPNIPFAPLFISRSHKIRYNGRLIKADMLIRQGVPGVKRIPYNGKKMYNILMDKYSQVVANGVKVETLHPSEHMDQILQIKTDMMKETNNVEHISTCI